MKVNLHIERLVLDGVGIEPHQRAGLKAAVEAELASALAGNGVGADLQGGGSFRSMRADSISVGGQNEPAQLGQQIGQAVFGGINR